MCSEVNLNVNVQIDHIWCNTIFLAITFLVMFHKYSDFDIITHQLVIYVGFFSTC